MQKKSIAALVPIAGSIWILKAGVDEYCENLKEVEDLLDIIDGTSNGKDFNFSKCYDIAKNDAKNIKDTINLDFLSLTDKEND